MTEPARRRPGQATRTVEEWNLRYGVAWERITGGIRAKFRSDQLATVQAIAEGGGARLLPPPAFLEGVV